MNNRKVIIYISSILCLIMPVLSLEGIIPWIVCLFVIHKNIKIYKKQGNIKKILVNLFICIIFVIFYNVLGRIIQDILVKLLVWCKSCELIIKLTILGFLVVILIILL